ncbi:MBL fold metallo-hydrolase [Arenibaculum sp.]|jgi:glyoxylase-like metal-dependent hydrolase (beta-lactamase superfamily II)|uniref:MBL fold metallo-hydrolase n=1 Tax=Arenibaculum sp. TaxID=2865862 RepID=UPI002E0E656C|nr:MBL fold metallo-hydrolase [Arenibaculum sp.]
MTSSNPLRAARRDELSYPFSDPPVPGEAAEIADGVLWVRMPLPFALDHINVWLLEDEAGWTIVDTGIGGGRTRALWERLFAGAMKGNPVTRVVATHFHPDHVGLAGWLAERWQAPLFASLTEWLFGRVLCMEASAGSRTQAEAFYRAAGLDADLAHALTSRGNGYAQAVTSLPASISRLKQGDGLVVGNRRWEVLIGRGHTPEHVCLHDRSGGVLIAGDQILPHISPNVSVWPSEPAADPLADFLDSLDALSALPADTLVLPSHGLPFRGVHARAAALRRHHEERLAGALAACAEPRTVSEVMRTMFAREMDNHQMMFAVGEALAHLNRLVEAGLLRRRPHADGAWRYLAV